MANINIGLNMQVEKRINRIETGCNCYFNAVRARKRKKTDYLNDYAFGVLRIVMSVTLVALCYFVHFPYLIKFFSLLCAVLISASSLLLGIVNSIVNRQFFSEYLLITLVVAIAFVIGEYFESVMTAVLFSVGELFERIAIDKSRRKVAEVNELYISEACLVSNEGIANVLPKYVQVGSSVKVKKGEIIPFDGKLLSENAIIDLKPLTGESKPYIVKQGEKVYSGSVNVKEAIIIETIKEYDENTIDKITEFVDKSIKNKAKSQKFITKFAKIYTPIVFAFALIIALIVPFFDKFNFVKWLYKALAFLVVSCPCALVISIPLAFFCGIGGLAKKGVLVNGCDCVDALSNDKIQVDVAMGKSDSIKKIEMADVVILDNDDKKVDLAVRHAKKVKIKVVVNVVLSIVVKVVVMVLSVILPLPIYFAMLADVSVILLTVINSFSCYFVR